MDLALRVLVLTDLVDSTGLVARMGDTRAAETFAQVDAAVRDLLATHGGVEIDRSDGFLLLFERPLPALRFATELHRALRALSDEHGLPLRMRVGVHMGDVALRRNPPEHVARGAKPLEVEGLAKPVAARIMSLAAGGQTREPHHVRPREAGRGRPARGAALALAGPRRLRPPGRARVDRGRGGRGARDRAARRAAGVREGRARPAPVVARARGGGGPRRGRRRRDLGLARPAGATGGPGGVRRSAGPGSLVEAAADAYLDGRYGDVAKLVDEVEQREDLAFAGFLRAIAQSPPILVQGFTVDGSAAVAAAAARLQGMDTREADLVRLVASFAEMDPVAVREHTDEVLAFLGRYPDWRLGQVIATTPCTLRSRASRRPSEGWWSAIRRMHIPGTSQSLHALRARAGL